MSYIVYDYAVYGYAFFVTFYLLWLAFSRIGNKKPADKKDEKIAKKVELNKVVEDIHLRIPAYLRDTKRLVKLSATGQVNYRFPSMFEIKNMGKVHHQFN